MTTYQFFTTAWTWNSIVFILSAVALIGYFLAFGQRGRPLYFAAAVVVFLLALISPFSALANGYLFSAHMVQHILLVLIVPALLLLSLPRSFSLRPPVTSLTHPVIGWIAGVGVASINGKRLLVAGARAARGATPFTARGDYLPLYRLRGLQRARHYPDLCARFDLSCLSTPGRPIGDTQHHPRRLGPNQRSGPADRRTADVGSDVCDLRICHFGPARSLAFISTTDTIKCLTNNQPRNIRTRCHPAGRCYPTRHCRTRPTSRLG